MRKQKVTVREEREGRLVCCREIKKNVYLSLDDTVSFCPFVPEVNLNVEMINCQDGSSDFILRRTCWH